MIEIFPHDKAIYNFEKDMWNETHFSNDERIPKITIEFYDLLLGEGPGKEEPIDTQQCSGVLIGKDLIASVYHPILYSYHEGTSIPCRIHFDFLTIGRYTISFNYLQEYKCRAQILKEVYGVTNDREFGEKHPPEIPIQPFPNFVEKDPRYGSSLGPFNQKHPTIEKIRNYDFVRHDCLGDFIIYRLPEKIENVSPFRLLSFISNDPIDIKCYGYPVVPDINDFSLLRSYQRFHPTKDKHGIYNEMLDIFGENEQRIAYGQAIPQKCLSFTNASTEKGMSGGPIIYEEDVIGINCGAWEFENRNYFFPIAHPFTEKYLFHCGYFRK